jgi:hypothetical protein
MITLRLQVLEVQSFTKQLYKAIRMNHLYEVINKEENHLFPPRD